MEEDIKRLEEMIENANVEDADMNDCLGGEHIEALQNLLTRYKEIEQENNNFKQAAIINDRLYQEVCNKNKELEEKLDNSRKANELLNKTNNELRWEKRTMYSKAVNDIISKFNLGDEFIPVQKVKEKIEEYQKTEKEMHENKNHSNDINEIYKYAVEEDKAKYGAIVLQDLLERSREDVR